MKTEFCRLSWISINTDRRDFESGDIKLQEAALERFYNSGRLHHGKRSLMYCLDKVPELPTPCWLNKDWKCLARTARAVEQALDEAR